MKLPEAAHSGNRASLLHSLLDQLCLDAGEAVGRDVAGLSRQIRETLVEMAAPSELRRERLTLLRDRLVDQYGDCGMRDTPALARELRKVVADLEGVGTGNERSVSDEIAAKRALRRAAAAQRESPAVGDERGS